MQISMPSHVVELLQTVQDALQEVSSSPKVFDMLIFVRGLISRQVRPPHAGLRAHRRPPALLNPYQLHMTKLGMRQQAAAREGEDQQRSRLSRRPGRGIQSRENGRPTERFLLNV